MSQTDEIASFAELTERHALAEQSAWLERLAPEQLEHWLADPAALDLLIEHAEQRLEPKRARALLWRWLRDGRDRAGCLRRRLHLLMLLDRTWHAFELVERWPELVAGEPKLGELRFALLGAMRRIRSARAQAEQLAGQLEPWERTYLEARLAWMDDERPRSRELFDQIEEQAGARPAYWSRRLHVSLELGHIEEAEAIGRRGHERFPESLHLLFSLSRVLEVQQRDAEAAALLRRALALSPACHYARWIEHRLELIEGLQPPDVLLPVQTLQQRRAYCGPNTLSLLCRFWGRETSQEEIAEGIWDQGTSYAAMWRWARAQDYVAPVFSGNPTLIKALLDRGVPVVTERSWARGGHYYIFVGYCSTREEFVLRDPDAAELVRYRYADFDALFGAQDGWCMLLVPAERGDLLDGLELPHAAAREAADAIGDRLFRDDPATLLAELAALDAEALPGTRDLLLLSLADQTGDRERLREAGERLRGKSPRSAALVSRVLRSYSNHYPAAECLELSAELLALERHPETLANHVELLLETGDHAAAQRWSRRILAHYPGEPSSYLSMANLLIRAGAEEKALDHLHVALEIDCRDPYVLTSLGSAQLTVGHFEPAQEQFEKALALRPGWYWPLFMRANGLERAGLHQPAIETFRANLEATPWYMPNYRNLASLLEDAGDPVSAEQVLEQGVERSSDPRALVLDLGYLFQRQGRFDRARESFTALLEEHPDYTAARVALARQALVEGRPEEAIPLLEQAIDETPGFAWAVRSLADCYDRTGRHEEEVALLWRWCREHPLDSDFDVALADNLAVLGREQELVDHLARLAAGDVEPAGFCCRLAALLQRRRRWDEARPWIERALALSPEEAWAHGLQGDEHWEQQRFGEAAAAYRRALELRPGYLWVIRRMAEHHVRRYEEQAIDYGKRLVSLDSSELSFLLEIFESLGRDEEAYEFLVREGETLVREQDAVQVHCGLIQERLGNLDAARRHHERALYIAPHNAWAMCRLAGVLIRQHEPEWAERLYREAIRIAPDYGWAREEYVQFLLARGRKEEALEVAREGFARNPGDGQLQAALRNLYLGLERIDEGVAFLESVAGTAEEPADIWCHIAILLYEADREEEALRAVERAIEIDPSSAWARRIAGLAHQALGDFAGAEAEFRRCLELSPGDRPAWRNLTRLHRDRGEHDVALDCIRRWARQDPEHHELLDDLFEICSEGGLVAEGEALLDELQSVVRWQDHLWLVRGRLRELAGDRAGARAAYDEALSCNATFQQGLLHRARLDPRATADLQRLLELNPSHGEALAAYLDRLDPHGEGASGLAAIERALAAAPDVTELHWQANRFAERTGDPAASLALLEPLLPVVREPHSLHCYLGGALLAAGRIEEARAAFEAALELRPAYYWAHSRLGDLWVERGDDQRAEACYRGAIEASPDYAWPHEALARLLAERGDADGHWEAVAHRLALFPDDQGCQYDLQELALAQQRIDPFVEHVLELVPRSRAPHELYTRIAHVLLEAGRPDEATEQVDRALAANPRAWWALAKKGDVLSAQDRPEQALPWYVQALEVKPDEWHSAGAAFRLRKQLGFVEDAERELLAALERLPECRELFDVAVAHFREADAPRGAREMVRLANAGDRPLRAALAAAELFDAGGRVDLAIKRHERTIERLPHEEEPYLALIDIHHRRGEHDRVVGLALRAVGACACEHAELVEMTILALHNGYQPGRLLQARRLAAGLDPAAGEEGLAALVESCLRLRGFGPQPDPFGAGLLAAVDLTVRGRPRDAVELCRKLLVLRPASLYARYLLGEALGRCGRHVEAVTELERFLARRCPRDVDRARLLVATGLLRAGQVERAHEAMQRVLAEIDEGATYFLWGLCEACEIFAWHAAAGWRWNELREWLRRRKPVADHGRPRLVGFWTRLVWAAITRRG